jgi:hypothetical protein
VANEHNRDFCAPGLDNTLRSIVARAQMKEQIDKMPENTSFLILAHFHNEEGRCTTMQAMCNLTNAEAVYLAEGFIHASFSPFNEITPPDGI